MADFSPLEILGDMRAARPTALLRTVIPLAGLATLALFALLYRFDSAEYYRTLAFVGIQPFRYPFLDLQYVLTVVDCWQRGIDVYVANPCDVLDRPMGYSPLWLRATFLPGEDWTDAIGLGLVVLFFLSLALLARPRSGREAVIMLAATLSPVTAFAVERANIDLAMFLLALAAGLLLLGPLRRRLFGYALIVLAGLLKFYPLALMALTLRERPRRFLWINGIVAALVLGFVLWFAGELREMAPNIPRGSSFSDLFGAWNLPEGIAETVAAALSPARAAVALRAVRIAVFVLLFLAMARGLLRLIRWRAFRLALTQAAEPERMFLLIGATLVCGCFFGGQSIGYRGIHLLFTLPGLLVLARAPGDEAVRAAARRAALTVVALMWAGFFTWHGFFPRAMPVLLGDASGAGVLLALWLARELLWWRVATVLLAILVTFAADRLQGAIALQE